MKSYSWKLLFRSVLKPSDFWPGIYYILHYRWTQKQILTSVWRRKLRVFVAKQVAKKAETQLLCKDLSRALESDFDTYVVRDSVKRWSHRHTIAYVDAQGDPIMEPLLDATGKPILQGAPIEENGESVLDEGQPILLPKEITRFEEGLYTPVRFVLRQKGSSKLITAYANNIEDLKRKYAGEFHSNPKVTKLVAIGKTSGDSGRVDFAPMLSFELVKTRECGFYEPGGYVVGDKDMDDALLMLEGLSPQDTRGMTEDEREAYEIKQHERLLELHEKIKQG